MPYKDYEQQKARAREYYWKHKKHVLANVRRYYLEHFEKRAIQKKRWAIRNHDKLRIWRREYFRRYDKFKQQAHRKVYRAVMSGCLIRPTICSRCQKSKPLHAHHRDYSKPLQVQWLCYRCHKVAHNREV